MTLLFLGSCLDWAAVDKKTTFQPGKLNPNSISAQAAKRANKL